MNPMMMQMCMNNNNMCNMNNMNNMNMNMQNNCMNNNFMNMMNNNMNPMMMQMCMNNMNNNMNMQMCMNNCMDLKNQRKMQSNMGQSNITKTKINVTFKKGKEKRTFNVDNDTIFMNLVERYDINRVNSKFKINGKEIRGIDFRELRQIGLVDNSEIEVCT